MAPSPGDAEPGTGPPPAGPASADTGGTGTANPPAAGPAGAGQDLPLLPADLALRTPRLRLDPVTRADADELRALHGDPALFRFTGRPRHLDAGLDVWLGAQESRTSPTGAALWLTWLLRPSGGGPAVGQAQATVVSAEGGPQAELSWLLARGAQGQGLAAEAVRAVAGWLGERLDVRRLHAHIAPGNRASERVAERLGLAPGSEVLDGERLWSGRVPP